MNNYSDISIVFIGYDGYVDVWSHCFELLNKYWEKRPKTYLVTQELNPNYKQVEVINAGKEAEWSRKVQVALKEIKTKYVLLMLEDFFITDYVDNRKFTKVVDLIKNNNIIYYQLFVQLPKFISIKGKRYKNNNGLCIIPPDKKYPINLQAVIWDRDYLEKVVGEGNYNAWQFEIKYQRMDNINKTKIQYLIDKRNILNITHAVVQSSYLRGAVKKLKKMGINVIGERKILSRKDDFMYNFKLFAYGVAPRFLVNPMKKIGRMMKIDFVTDRIKID